MFASLPQDWSTLQRMAKQMETECEANLTLLSKSLPLNSTSLQNHSMTSIPTLDTLFEKLQQVVDQMESVLTSDSPSSSFHLVQRYRDTLQLHLREFRKLKGTVQSSRAHTELLTKSNPGSNSKSNASQPDGTDSLLEERIQVDRATFMLDDLIDQAHATRSGLLDQRNTLHRAHQRIQSLDFSSVKRLLQRIRWRRHRNTWILASVFALCTFLLMLYLRH
ncbi:Golgi SNAP receptor complex member 1 [Coelomomyces lativittatus]|nr:Golgi SNAP receptor complex member 1 [Coelomomyces lativittatus]KAJ1517636.1 Golgi SNAP receptor complex member 1 [Coelomomyces lativittatus]KAJ1518623.1 Golgi SNAP receptor complex member 1 [Coelomomyces lativittatus]